MPKQDELFIWLILEPEKVQITSINKFGQCPDTTKLMFEFIYFPPTISAGAVYPQDFLSKVESILLPYMLSRLK